MIKEGYDHFEVTRQEPKVNFCEKKYVFDAVKPPDAKQDLVFQASAKCPAYVIPDEVADAVRERQQEEQAETAKLIARGTPVAKLNTGIDGGMNQVFAARVPGGNTGLSEGGEGQSLSLLALSRAPGTIPSTVNPPHAPGADEPVVAVAAPASAPPPTRVASAAPTAQSDGFFSNLARKIGLGGTADTTASAPPPAKPKAEAKRGEQPHPEAAVPKAAASKPAETKQAATRPQLKPSVTDSAPAAEAPAPKDTLVAGSRPIMQSNSFDSRFGAVK
jgi:hypothetical protein